MQKRRWNGNILLIKIIIGKKMHIKNNKKKSIIKSYV